MKLSDLLNKTLTGIGTFVNDYRRDNRYMPEGSPGIFEALKVLSEDNKRKKEMEQYGGYTLQNPIELMYGTANRSNDFESIGKYRDFANERGLYASPENRQLPELEKQYSSEFTPQGDVLGLASQYDQRDLAGIPQQPVGQSRYPKVYEFTHKIYPGSRITGDYYNALESGLDEDTLKRVIAISVAETGAGKAASSFKGDGSLKQNNFYGIHIAKDGKPANQYDPDLPTMIEDLKRNFGPGARYSTINRDTLAYYVQGKPYSKLTEAQKKSVDGELERYNWAYSKLN